jgi:hypothetical protein
MISNKKKYLDTCSDFLKSTQQAKDNGMVVAVIAPKN